MAIKQSGDFLNDSFLASIRDGWLNGKEFFDKKRYKAVEHIYSRVDMEVLNSLPPIIIFTPSLDHSGRAMTMDTVGKAVIYLSPTLEFNTQRDVDFVFAHEIAHVALGHHLPGNAQMALNTPEMEHSDRPAEKAADALAKSWGFWRRRRGKTGFVKFVEAAGK
jgi:hypothetical protein